jgi:hypothetical protein
MAMTAGAERIKVKIMAQPRAPLPWEVKTVMALLGLLCLEVLRELVVFALSSSAPPSGSALTGPLYHGDSEFRISGGGSGMGAVFFLAIYIGLVIGLTLRSPLSWLMGLILVGGAGVVNLLFLLPAFQHLFNEQARSMFAQGPQEKAWTIAKIVMQFGVAGLLGIAWLRGRLKED